MRAVTFQGPGEVRIEERPAPEPNPGPGDMEITDPLNASTVHGALREVLPEDAIVVLESPSSTLALRNQLRLSRPGSYYFSAGGGLCSSTASGRTRTAGASQRSSSWQRLHPCRWSLKSST